MKTRLFFAALLLLSFGTMKAQVNEPKQYDPKADSIMKSRMAEMSQIQEQFAERMRELGMNLQYLSDSVDWKSFEQDMEKWGADMEEWGNKMERWGNDFEKSFEQPYSPKISTNDGSQVRSIIMAGSGDVRIEQSQDGFSLRRDSKNTSERLIMNGSLLLKGSSDYEVALPQLDEVVLRSSGDVIGRGTIKGQTLRILAMGSGDIVLDVDYDTVNVQMTGSGDVTLKGRCKVIDAKILGSGDLKMSQLQYADSNITATGSGEVLSNGHRDVVEHKSHQGKRSEKKSLLYDANWNGFEAGLNMLMGPGSVGYEYLELRPMRSWVFNFNIADVGIAFDRRHTAGLYTGIGLGWNNYSFNNPVRLTKGENHLEAEWIDPAESVVKRSKLGVLYVQAPLMIEVRPTRRFYIAAGVTGGLRVNTWTKIVFRSGDVNKVHSDYYVNPFKLDATLRIGGNNLGFFAQYNLLPTFDEAHAPTCHTANFGFSINF